MLTIMSSRARRPRRPLAAVPPPTTPPPAEADTAAAGIQALVERIHAGELDAELPVLAAAITPPPGRLHPPAPPAPSPAFHNKGSTLPRARPGGPFAPGDLRGPPLAL